MRSFQHSTADALQLILLNRAKEALLCMPPLYMVKTGVGLG